MTAATYTASLRWPLQPLLDRAKASRADLRRLGIAGGTIYDADTAGLTDDKADTWATMLNLHPSQVWPGWDAAALLPSDDLFVNGSETCGPGWRQAWEWAEAEAVAPTPIDTRRPHRTERRERVA